MARTILETEGEDVGVFGGEYDIYGTTTGGEEVTILTGTDVWLDPSFNTGGDTIRLPGEAEEYTARVEGSYVILTSVVNDVTVEIPVGPEGITIVFGGDDSRTLYFDTTDNRVEIDGEVIDGTADPLSPGDDTPPPPPVEYTIEANSPTVTEGDSGARLLTYTITLDQPAEEAVTLTYTTIGTGTAEVNDDYQPVTGTVTIPAGSTTAFVSVPVFGDTMIEGNETVQLQISGEDLVATQVLTGTIIDDDQAESNFNLQEGSETIIGTPADDTFRASNNELGSGDYIDGREGNDRLILGVDQDAAGFFDLIELGDGDIDYAGFESDSVEQYLITNDSPYEVVVDMSGAEGVELVGSVNSSETVTFEQVTSLADVLVDNLTYADGTDVNVYYRDGVTAGAADAVTVTVSNSDVDDITLGTIDNLGNSDNDGIETVNLVVDNAGGSSYIEDLDTELTNLNIDGTGDLEIDNALEDTVRTIDATGLAGDIDIDFSNNDAGEGVEYDGSEQDDIVDAGAGDDDIDTNGGDDTVYANDGDDTIDLGTGDNFADAGGGNDFITATTDGSTLADGFNNIVAGTGNDTVVLGDGGSYIVLGDGNDSATTGAGNDTVFAGPGADTISTDGGSDTVYFYDQFGIEDEVDLGADDDFLYVDAGSVDADYTNVSNAENLVLTTAGVTVLGAEAQQAGITTVYGTAGNDTIDSTAFTRGLTFYPGTGDDNIQSGSGNDMFVFYDDELNDMDVIDANGGDRDTLDLRGSTVLATGANVDDIEVINLYPDFSLDDNDYTITTDAGWVSAADGVLEVNGADLLSDEEVIFDSSLGDYSTDIHTGAGDDEIETSTGAYNDCVNSGAGDDTISTNLGNDDIAAGAGNDEVYGGDGNDRIHLGDGDDVAFGGTGEDQFYGGAGADEIDFGDDLQTDTAYYNAVGESTGVGVSRDTISNFDSGEDVIDITELMQNDADANAGTSEFISANNLDAAEAQMVANDGIYSIVFIEEIPGEAETGLDDAEGFFFVDLNDSGDLDGEDLQINIVGDNVAEGDVVNGTNLDGQSGYDLFMMDNCAFA